MAERIAQLIPESGRPLVLPSGENSTWMWLNPVTRLSATRMETIAQLARTARATIGIGEPCEGLIGFRETHEQAEEALTCALRLGDPLARYSEIALVSDLTAQPAERCE